MEIDLPNAMSENDLKVQALFVEYIKQARAIYKTEQYNHPSEIDSNVSIITHALFNEFEQYRKSQ